MYVALMLAKFTKNDKDAELRRKASVIDLEQ